MELASTLELGSFHHDRIGDVAGHIDAPSGIRGSAFLHKPLRHREADPAVAASNQRRFTGKSHNKLLGTFDNIGIVFVLFCPRCD
jgi:hypothetical protein